MSKKAARKTAKTQTLRERLLALRWGITATVVFVACVATGLLRNDNAQDMRSLYQQLGQAQSQQDALQEQHSRLLLERSAYSSLMEVEKVARTELNMVFPEQMDEVAP